MLALRKVAPIKRELSATQHPSRHLPRSSTYKKIGSVLIEIAVENDDVDVPRAV